MANSDNASNASNQTSQQGKPDQNFNPIEHSDLPPDFKPVTFNPFQAVLEANREILEAEKRRDPRGWGSPKPYRDGSRIRFTDGPVIPPDGAGAALPVPASPPVSPNSEPKVSEQERLQTLARRQAQVAAIMANMEAERTRKLAAPVTPDDEDDEPIEVYQAEQDKKLLVPERNSRTKPDAAVVPYVSDYDPLTLKQLHTLDLPKILELPDPVYLLDGYLSEDSYAVLYGRSQSFKSFVALDWAMQVARTRPVIYIAGEGKLGYRNRTAAWLQHHSANKEDYNFNLWDGSVQMGDPIDVERFLKVCEAVRPALIVMDTLSTVTRGLDENSSRDMGIFVGAIQRIRHKTGACVLVVHHSGKDGSKGHRGSSKIIDDADTAFCVERKDMSELVTTLKFEKAKDADLGQPLALTLEKVGNSLVPVSSAPALLDKPRMAEHMLTEGQRKALIALDNAPDGLTYSELLEATGVSKSSFSTWMNSEFSQYVERVGEGIGRVYVLTEAGQDILAPWNMTA